MEQTQGFHFQYPAPLQQPLILLLHTLRLSLQAQHCWNFDFHVGFPGHQPKACFFFLSLSNATLKLRSKRSSFAFKPSTRFLNQNFAAAVWSKANCSSLLPAASAALTAPDICFCQERKKAWLEDTRGADLLSKKVLFLQSHFTLWDTEHLHGQQGA